MYAKKGRKEYTNIIENIPGNIQNMLVMAYYPIVVVMTYYPFI